MRQQLEPEAYCPFCVTRHVILQLVFLPLTAFFIIGICILITTDMRQAITDAGNEVPELVKIWYSYMGFRGCGATVVIIPNLDLKM